MSVVANYILITAINETGVAKFNGTIPDGLGIFERVDRFSGGFKVMESEVYLFSVARMIDKPILESFDSVRWDYPESCQLLIREQWEDRFSCYNNPVGPGEEG